MNPVQLSQSLFTAQTDEPIWEATVGELEALWSGRSSGTARIRT
jgi:hypothetical protein